jgi:hypothetical protein
VQWLRKALAWRRFSDDSLVVALWRMDQVGTVTNDFDAVVTFTLPAGFAPGATAWHDAHADAALRPVVPLLGRLGAAGFTVPLTSRAGWLVVQNAKPRPLAALPERRCVLPAAFDVPGESSKSCTAGTVPVYCAAFVTTPDSPLAWSRPPA